MITHRPVLLKESIEYLNLKKGDTVVDATLGGGGHSLEILKKILPGGKLVAIDRDESAIHQFSEKLKDIPEKPRAEDLLLVHNNYSHLGGILGGFGILSVQAVIADLGVSSYQVDSAERGFSFMADGPLDMRMDKKEEVTAADVVNDYTEEKLEKILREYGDERYCRRIAQAIVERRVRKKFRTTGELVTAIESAVPKKYHFGKIHFATRTFQALRIEVNQEFEHLGHFIAQAIEFLERDGRLAIISFHSGEDRMVKQNFRENAGGCICPKEFPICRCKVRPLVKIITKKPVVPGSEEISSNPRARSAKMRVVEKI